MFVYVRVFVCLSKVSSSCDSLDVPCAEYAKSYDAVVFDVLKVTPEEFAVSMRFLQVNRWISSPYLDQ